MCFENFQRCLILASIKQCSAILQILLLFLLILMMSMVEVHTAPSFCKNSPETYMTMIPCLRWKQFCSDATKELYANFFGLLALPTEKLCGWLHYNGINMSVYLHWTTFSNFKIIVYASIHSTDVWWSIYYAKMPDVCYVWGHVSSTGNPQQVNGGCASGCKCMKSHIQLQSSQLSDLANVFNPLSLNAK